MTELLDPLYRNLVAAIATVLYVKAVIFLSDLAVDRSLLSSKLTRKIIHVAAGSWLLFWPAFTDKHPTWRLNILVPAVYTIQLFFKAVILNDPNDTDVKTMSRTGSPKDLLFGPIHFTLVMSMVGLKYFRKEEAIFVMGCLGYGDGIAPLVGSYFPYGKYPTFPFGLNDKKTLSGSLGFFVASIVGYYCLRGVATETTADFQDVVKVAATCTIAEGITGKWDNIAVVLTALATLKYMM